LEIFERLERKAKIVRLKNQNKHKRNDFGGARIETLACTKRTYGIVFSVALYSITKRMELRDSFCEIALSLLSVVFTLHRVARYLN